MDNNKNIICYPSFKFERRTKAFNKYIWWFVSLISMFAIGLLLAAFHTFLCWFLNLKSTFIMNNFSMIISVLIIVFVGLSYQLLLFLLNLMTSYRFEDNKIIKGRIKTVDSVKGVNLIIDTVLVANMLAKAGDTSNVVAQNAAINWNNILNLIQLNMKHQFVDNTLIQSCMRRPYMKIRN